ncbi:hypothetical protein NQZ79_g6956 [Umbelopsis isabellina]|nr:hypothetical protein NQZ79_g6956 [Umbelopsis isabellina]
MSLDPENPKSLSGNSRPYFAEEPAKRDSRLKSLFSALANPDTGYIDTESVLKGIQTLTYQLPAQKRDDIVKKLVEKCDTSKDGLVDFAEFQTYVVEKEEELWHLFEQIDKSGDQMLQREEVKSALRRGGIAVSDKEVEQFVKAMDQDGDGQIDFAEWRDYLLFGLTVYYVITFGEQLLPKDTTSIVEVFRYYNSATQLNQDADVVIPPNDETAQYALQYLLAGGVAGAVSRTCTAPLDRLKVHLITYVAETTTGSSDSVTKKPPRTSLMQAIKTIYRSGGGIRAFFSIKFWSFEKAKVALSKIEGIDEKNHISTVARFAAGGIAGIISQFAIYPVETLKIRIQSQPFTNLADKSVQKSVNSAIVSTAKQMYRSGGLMAFWPGLTLGLIGVFPYQALDMGIYDTLKSAYLESFEKDEKSKETPSMLVLWGCGIASGSIGASSVYPLSMIRTRLQAKGTPGAAWSVARDTLRNEGLVGFYAGLTPTLIKVVPAASISYVVYEWSKRLLNVNDGD